MHRKTLQEYEDGFNAGVDAALHVVEAYLENMSDEEAKELARRLIVIKEDARMAYAQRIKD